MFTCEHCGLRTNRPESTKNDCEAVHTGEHYLSRETSERGDAGDRKPGSLEMHMIARGGSPEVGVWVDGRFVAHGGEVELRRGPEGTFSGLDRHTGGLHDPDDQTLRRNFSVSESPREDSLVVLAMTGVGAKHLSADEAERLALELSLVHGCDPYFQRVKRFHDSLREESGADYLSVLAEEALDSDVALTNDPLDGRLADVTAERNRLFWSSFLNEEAGEVAGALTSGETPEDFEEEVADVLIVAFGIAEAFGFDPLEAFADKMDKNETKPKEQDGSGKLPEEARERW